VRRQRLVIVAGGFHANQHQLGPTPLPGNLDQRVQGRKTRRIGHHLRPIDHDLAGEAAAKHEPARLRHIDADQQYATGIQTLHQIPESRRTLPTDMPPGARHVYLPCH
jgi:hypothetical protein